ncbi:MAG: nitrilase-related carbon-nitrogen hydrolase [Candidatus Nanopelagicales bacterium]|nr:nitrilase-related carbon-nitrogen hydrolase [Candidatus Nanopelagicales bacterium]MDZ4250524.1 nitrilase-related carbon-nitrogen hydrolase [Candidatus Nanopelagicales bacterium]
MAATAPARQPSDRTSLPTEPPTSTRKTLLGLGLSAVSAVMLYVTCDGHGSLWPLIIVGFVPMYVAQYRLLPRRLSGLAVGIAFFGYWLSLLMYSSSVAEFLGGPLVALLIIIVAAAVMSVPLFVFGIFERPFSERTKYKWFVIQLPLVWVGLEVVFGANPFFATNYWMAYRMASVPALDQPVSVLSTPALSLLLMMINAGIAILVLKWIDRRWPSLASVAIPGRTVKWSAGIALCLTVIWIASSLLINARVNSQLGPVVRVAAVQPGNENRSEPGQRQAQDAPSEIERNVRLSAQMEGLTRDAAAQGAKLIVWPEKLLEYDAATEQGAWVGDLASETQTTIVAGWMPQSPDPSSANIAGAWLPSGQLAGIYYKIHPVTLEGESFNTPQEYPTFTTPVGQLGVLICFDHDFPDSSARLETLGGADILAVPALDPASIANLRWQSLTFRAIENRVPLVKTDVGWDSAIINANGVVADRTAVPNPDGAEEVLVADVNLGPRNSVFTKVGGYTFALLVVIGLVSRYTYQFRLARSDSG